MVAAYFAVSELAFAESRLNAPGFSIFGIDTNIEHMSRNHADFRVLFPSAPTFGNPNMAAQQGLFSLVKMADVSQPLDLEQAVETCKSSDQFPLSRPVLYKYTCLANQSRRLLKQLAQHRISAAHLFPGLDGVVNWMRERRIYE